jgi:hypothetical protein
MLELSLLLEELDLRLSKWSNFFSFWSIELLIVNCYEFFDACLDSILILGI